MYDIIQRVNNNKTGIYNRNPELIAIIGIEISSIIGDSHIHISEFIVAKVKGKIVGHFMKSQLKF